MAKTPLTVATIVKVEDLFLMVEEKTADGVLFNQSAGHVELGESILEASQRECLEETGFIIEPLFFIGRYRGVGKSNDPKLSRNWCRYVLEGTIKKQLRTQPSSEEILAIHWLSFDEIKALRKRLRSPLVLQCIEDFEKGLKLPLEMVPNDPL